MAKISRNPTQTVNIPNCLNVGLMRSWKQCKH